MSRGARWFGFALALAIGAPSAKADDARAPAATEARKEAARKFQEATRAFDVGDYHRAGEAYEAAYQLAPHEDPLWNAARAWHLTGELARAANLYARYLRVAPADARERAKAAAALSQLATKLARIEVQLGAGVDNARVDSSALDGPAAYVVPGTHIVRGRTAQGELEVPKSVRAGEAVSVVLAVPTAAPGDSAARRAPAAQETANASAPRPSEPPRSRADGWSPLVVVVEGSVTLALAGFVTWSGLETMSTLRRFEGTPSREALESGRSEQLRTNILLGATAGAALLTGVTALWLTDWGPARDVNVAADLGPGSGNLSMRGAF
ncbi:MAG: hypothetical protein IPG50_25290 [Myxococcales bacterium]|nr:hypothetical protein [Myxococcales bacterium]